MRVLNVVGARPNFMKMAPLVRELKARGIDQKLLHTGQHYDANMSKVFFEDLGMPEPDIYMGIGSGSHAEQTARVMIEFEKICANERPDLVVVVGDVNSTLACSIVAAKAWIPVAHVESGLRSFDMRMPEEINRLVTGGGCGHATSSVPLRLHAESARSSEPCPPAMFGILSARPDDSYGTLPVGNGVEILFVAHSARKYGHDNLAPSH